MSPREISGILLVGSPSTYVSGVCNRTASAVDGSILVVDVLGPELYSAVVTSVAVICSHGGQTGHMQSLCRSRGIPILRVAASDLNELVGHVTIQTDRQSVILGDDASPTQRAVLLAIEPDDLRPVCVVIADISDVQATNTLTSRVGQVGSYFIREEFVCLSEGLSPVDALSTGVKEAEEYGTNIASTLRSILNELLPGQRLIMRMLDLRSDDAAQITRSVEVDSEPNPELGLHGARWILKNHLYPRAFRALWNSIRDELEGDSPRLSFAVPFINDANEFLRLRLHLNLADTAPLSVFVETPSAVHSATDFSAAGASEIFVGTKDVIQFYLAADRGNHLVADSYQTRHPAVMAALRQVVDSCNTEGTPVHVFALGADLHYYLNYLSPSSSFMLCTAEFLHLIRKSNNLDSHRTDP